MNVLLDALQEQTPACDTRQWAQCLVTTAVFDVRWNSSFGAMLNLFRSLFVIVALGCGAVLFNNDSNRLVLRPIERMLRKVCSPCSLVDAAYCLVHDNSKHWFAECSPDNLYQ